LNGQAAVAGPPVLRRTTWQTIKNLFFASFAGYTTVPNVDGWGLGVGTWTYASATTITIQAGGVGIYSVGDKIRFKQGAGYKYFYVVEVADTLLTVSGGSDFTVATPTAITDVYYSHATCPVGFPGGFNYAATISGTGGSIGTYAETSYTSTFAMFGRTVHVQVQKYITNVGSWSGTLQILRPIASIGWTPFNAGGVYTYNTLTNKGLPYSSAASAYFNFVSLMGAANLQWGGAGVVVLDSVSIDGFYRI
jgi:hypothetical protein